MKQTCRISQSINPLMAYSGLHMESAGNIRPLAMHLSRTIHITRIEREALNLTASRLVTLVGDSDTHERRLCNAHHCVAERLSEKSWPEIPYSGSALQWRCMDIFLTSAGANNSE